MKAENKWIMCKIDYDISNKIVVFTTLFSVGFVRSIVFHIVLHDLSVLRILGHNVYWYRCGHSIFIALPIVLLY